MNDARPALVIGYGNTLRGDDAVGPRAAAVVQGWGLMDVTALAVTQLTPELAASLADSRLAIFVDARFAVEDPPAGVEVLALQPSSGSSVFGHSGEPRHLLALAQAVYGTCPQVWLVTVPTADLRLGDGLSPQAGCGLDAALGKIAGLLLGSHYPSRGNDITSS